MLLTSVILMRVSCTYTMCRRQVIFVSSAYVANRQKLLADFNKKVELFIAKGMKSEQTGTCKFVHGSGSNLTRCR